MASREASGKVLNAIARQLAMAGRRGGRPLPFDEDQLEFDAAGDLEPGKHARPQHALRHPRARHGRHRQRHGLDGLRAFASTFLVFSDYMRGRCGWRP